MTRDCPTNTWKEAEHVMGFTTVSPPTELRGRTEKVGKSFPTFSVRLRTSGGRVTVNLIRRSWVQFPPTSKDFFLPYLVPWLPLLELNTRMPKSKGREKKENSEHKTLQLPYANVGNVWRNMFEALVSDHLDILGGRLLRFDCKSPTGYV